MPDLGLTDALDLLLKAGPAKAAKLAEIKHRPGYSPAADFYRGAREAIIEGHESGTDKASTLKAIAARSANNAKKVDHYGDIATNYGKWWGAKMLKYFSPPRAFWSDNGVNITVNPELGLAFGGKRYVVKLHFKDAHISRDRCSLALELMSAALDVNEQDTAISILDVRRRRLHIHKPDPIVRAQLSAEAAWIASLWPHI